MSRSLCDMIVICCLSCNADKFYVSYTKYFAILTQVNVLLTVVLGVRGRHAPGLALKDA